MNFSNNTIYENAIHDICSICLEEDLIHSITFSYFIDINFAIKLYEFIIKNGLSCHGVYFKKDGVVTLKIMHSYCGFDYCSQCKTSVIASFHITN